MGVDGVRQVEEPAQILAAPRRVPDIDTQGAVPVRQIEQDRAAVSAIGAPVS